MTGWKTIRQFALLAGFTLFLAGGTCSVTVEPPPPPPPTPPPTTITVQIVNLTNLALDPEIFINAQAISDPAQLFVAPGKYTFFGLGRRGILGPLERERFTLNCADLQTLATQGGAFGDDLNNPAGRGQQRILVQALSYFCGDTITFTYSQRDGQFVTTFEVAVGQ